MQSKEVKENVKATETKVKEAAKAAETKVKEAAKDTAKAAETKVKEAAKTTAKKAAAAKTAAKATAKKTVAKAAAVEPQVIIQYQNNESDLAKVTERVKTQFVSEGHKAGIIKKINVYLKPEEYSAYYVINDKFSGRVDLF
ncbi:MAG: DUF6465 family protein [Lachnobacterium sp.]|nr:DUF6465 family protein [Lachnobacterium sp.]